jgi:TetR/AcrR family transcriptional regulator, mexCD-oprJ operon repressor
LADERTTLASEKTPEAESRKPQQQRADARRNVETILDAAERCLAANPDASMGDIADEAALGRVTLYGHFQSRAELVEVVARRVLRDANQVLAEVDLTGEPHAALARLVEASWKVTARSGSLVVAAEKALPPRVVREAHAGELEERVERFLAGGQRAGAFRSDLSTKWLVAVFHATLHAAAREIEAGRLQAGKASKVITATLLGAYRAPRDQPKPSATRRSRRR